MKHFPQIQTALRLDRILIFPSSWRYTPKKGQSDQGAQIDLLLDRNDDAITLCEIKYNVISYRLKKSAALNLDNKIEHLARAIPRALSGNISKINQFPMRKSQAF